MKTVGIITYHHYYNYGTMLQALALQHAVDKLGYQTELIDFKQDNSLSKAELLKLRLRRLPVYIKERKKYNVVYVKEGSQIVDFLNVIGAHIALMNFENIRILKEVRNSVNRQVNCETANISKTVNAAAKQIEDIKYIECNMGFSQLSDGLREVAELRLDYPESSLQELGKMLKKPISKSGVNHRLRKLSEIANDLRDKEDMKS